MTSESEDNVVHEPVVVEDASGDVTGETREATEPELEQSSIPDRLTGVESAGSGSEIGQSVETVPDTSDTEGGTPVEERQAVQDEETE